MLDAPPLAGAYADVDVSNCSLHACCLLTVLLWLGLACGMYMWSPCVKASSHVAVMHCILWLGAHEVCSMTV